MEPEGPLPCSEKPATDPYTAPVESSTVIGVSSIQLRISVLHFAV